MRLFAVGTKILGGVANIWGPMPPSPNVEPPCKQLISEDVSVRNVGLFMHLAHQRFHDYMRYINRLFTYLLMLSRY